MVDELFVASVDHAKDKDKQYYNGHSIQSTDFDTQGEKQKYYQAKTPAGPTQDRTQETKDTISATWAEKDKR